MKKINFVWLVAFLFLGVMQNLNAAQKSNDELHHNHIIGFDFAYYPGTHKGLDDTGFVPANYKRVTYKDLETRFAGMAARNDLGSALGIEAKIYYTFQTYIPAMRKDNMLMKDNNVKVNVLANVSPVSFETGLLASITPLAFLVFDVGTKVGTGWNFSALGINGLTINNPNFRYTEDKHLLDPVGGVISTTQLGVTFQFDIGAVVPGDWNHVVFAVVEDVAYQHFSAAKKDQFWVWEADSGENQNGFVWNQTFLIGYQMPKVPYLDTIGFIIETEQRVTGKKVSTMKSGGWGSDFLQVKFGPLMNFMIAEKYSLAFIAEFKNARHFTNESMGHRYFELRNVNTADPTYIQFDRIAISFRAKL